MGTLKKAVALLSAIGLMCVTSLFAATGWTRVDYTNSTTFVGFILVSDGYVPSAVAGDSIGAFVGDECRMKAKLFKSPNSDTLWLSAVLHGGGINPPNDPNPVSNDGEDVTFKIWHQATDKVVALAGTTKSIPGGNIFAYPLGKVDKSTDATIASLAIKNAQIKPVFAPETVEYTVELANGTALPVEADYTIATGDAKATVKYVHATNFTTDNKTTITVTAEDGKTVKVYTITFSESICTVVAPTVPEAVSACSGTDATVTATSTRPNATFSWKNEAGTVVGSSATLTTSTAGDYFVTQTDGCTGAPAKVTVSIITLDAIALAPDHKLSSPICESATVELAGIATPAGGKYSGTGVTEGVLSAAGLAGTGKTIIYTITKDNCSAQKTITYDVVAKPTVSLTGLPADVCKNGTAFALTGGSPADGVYSIDGNAVTSFNPALYSGAVAVKYTYSAVDGCSGDASSTITVNATPAVIAKDQVVILGGVNKAFELTVATGATVVWYNSNKAVIANADASFIPTETAEGVYDYYVSQKIGSCESELTLVSLTITPCTTEKPAVDKITASVCVGTAASFTATPASGNEIIWKDANGTVIPAIANVLTPNTDSKGSHTFYASQKSTAANSCESPQTKVTLDVNEVPVVSISIPSTPLTTASAAVEISVSPAQATLEGTGLAGKMFDPSVAGIGTHTLTATFTENGCTGTDAKDIIVSAEGASNASLLAAIADAKKLNAIEGYAKAQYIGAAAANSALQTAITAAETASSSTDATVLANALTALTNAVAEFVAKANPADYTALKAALDAADDKIATIGTNVGSEVGQYETSKVDALKAAIANGKTMFRTESQSTVDAATADIIKKTDIDKNQATAINYDALNAAITAATTKLANTVEGTAYGDQIAGSKAILEAAKAAASDFLTSTDQTAVTKAASDLVNAIAVYESLIVKAVDTKLLDDAIKAATAAIEASKQGYATGEYYNLSATDGAIKTALAEAKVKLAGFTTAGTLEEVAAAASALSDVTSAFIASANKADLTNLVQAINAAEAKFATASANLGTEPGQYLAKDVNDLQAAIEAAKALLKSSDDVAIASGITALNAKADFSAIPATTTVNVDALKAEIAKAEAAVATAVVGTAVGNYPADAKTAVEAAIATAKEALKSTDQAVVDKAAADLKTAFTTFEGTVIKDPVTVLNYDKLNTSIDSALTLLDETKIGDATGNIALADWKALAEAKKVAENAKKTATSQTAVDAAESDLNDAITLFILSVKVDDILLSASIVIYPTTVSETLNIEGMSGFATISVVNSSASFSQTFTTSAAAVLLNAVDLAKGSNIVTVLCADGSTAQTTVIVE